MMTRHSWTGRNLIESFTLTERGWSPDTVKHKRVVLQATPTPAITEEKQDEPALHRLRRKDTRAADAR
jgi:hypothetical protein